MTAKSTVIIPLDGSSPVFDGATKRNFSPAFRCPAVGNDYLQKVQYYHHGVAMPLMPLELGLTPAGRAKLTAPAKLTQCYPETALFWDTPCWHDAVADSPAMFWGSSHTASGFSAFCTEIDDNEAAPSTENALLSHPEFPERRFRSPSGDRFASSADPLKNPSGPIAFPTDQFLRTMGAGLPSANTDYAGNTVWNPGNARFRHNGDGCNVGFVDGSVKTLFLNQRHAVSGSGSSTYADTDFRRYMLMIKWPQGGIKDSGTYN